MRLQEKGVCSLLAIQEIFCNKQRDGQLGVECVHRWCVLRRVRLAQCVVCESSGLLGQRHCQQTPTKRPAGRGSGAEVVHPRWYYLCSRVR